MTQSPQLRPMLENLGDIEDRIKAAERVALFLDFDGTISRIVPKPADAELDTDIKRVLKSLAANPSFSVGIVSGRALDDVRTRMGMPDLIYVGNHGLEIEAGDTRYKEPEAECLRRELKSISLQLQLALADIEGLEIEDKGLTVSVHFRQVPAELHEWVRKTSFDAVSRSRSFRASEGKRVVEVRPQLPWNKGHAVRWLLQQALPDGALPIYIGDDVTDEDAFAAISQGITIRVGGLLEASTQAQYGLPDVCAVGQFLSWLNHAKSNASVANAQRAGR